MMLMNWVTKTSFYVNPEELCFKTNPEMLTCIHVLEFLISILDLPAFLWDIPTLNKKFQ